MTDQGVVANIRPAVDDDLPAMQRVIAEGMRGCGFEVSDHLDEERRDHPWGSSWPGPVWPLAC